METVNKVILKGKISGLRKIRVKDNEVARFVLRTQYVNRCNDSSIRVETEWHNIVVWNTDDLYDVLYNGKTVELDGRLRYTKYVSSEGIDKVIAEIVVSKLVSVE